MPIGRRRDVDARPRRRQVTDPPVTRADLLAPRPRRWKDDVLYSRCAGLPRSELLSGRFGRRSASDEEVLWPANTASVLPGLDRAEPVAPLLARARCHVERQELPAPGSAWRGPHGIGGRMNLISLGYVGVRATALDEWDGFATNLLGMQRVDSSSGTRAYRMDDRRQRLIVSVAENDGLAFYGWEVADARALDALAARLENNAIKVARGSRALADERHVVDVILFHDPAGNRLEVFHGAQIASDAFKPGRSISGFRTGPLGMGHAVLNVERVDDVVPFYRDILGFKLSDYILKPFKAYFFHINPRHDSLAFIEAGATGIHHLMVETCILDDVGQAYDLVLRQPEMLGTTLGRHVNDEVTSFYSWSPFKRLS